jgi:predicted metalloendopeptidase
LKSSLHDRIKRLDWISENTRKQALKKLDAIEIKIGYPDTWRNYSALKIDKKTYVENAIEADEFEFQRNLNKLGKPVDRKEWSLPPTTVDAFYNPNLNEIVFPAGILQPPFFDMDADDATIYGGIGSIIGHELTHGFDDQGRQFDAVGNLKDWWTPEDAKNYSARAALVEEQFSKYIPIDTFHINGNLTLGENIADLGGVKIAYYAFLKSFKGKTHPAPIDGFTAEQRFFLAYAQAWKRLTYPESVKLMLASDPHSPPKFRVNGPLQNLEEFAKAFNCTSGNMVNKTKRAEIW